MDVGPPSVWRDDATEGCGLTDRSRGPIGFALPLPFAARRMATVVGLGVGVDGLDRGGEEGGNGLVGLMLLADTVGRVGCGWARTWMLPSPWAVPVGVVAAAVGMRGGDASVIVRRGRAGPGPRRAAIAA